MPTAVSLSKLVDLALGSPEVGAVNFNILHSLLHAMLLKLNLQDVKTDVDEHDRELLSTHAGVRAFSAFSLPSADSGKGDDSFSVSEDSFSDKSSYSSAKRSPYHTLEKKVAELVKQMDDFSKLPSNQQLMSRTGGPDSERPVTDMWQHLQLKKRVDANQLGIDKLMSLVEDLMKEMKELKDSQADLLQKVNAVDIDDIKKRLNSLDDQFKDVSSRYDGLSSQLSKFPSLDDLDQYLTQFVTWPGLEDALKGVRQDFESRQAVSVERIVTDHGIQTEVNSTEDIKSRPSSSKPASRASSARSHSRTSMSGPSSELLDVLERLGRLIDAHQQLEARVDELEKLMQLKANAEDLKGLGIPEDLLTSMKNLRDEVTKFKEGKDKDDAVTRKLQESLQKHQVDIDKLKKTMEAIIAENSERVKEIQDLLKFYEHLNATKADKDYVDMEVDVKADRNQLEKKVNHTLFDSTTSELNRMIKDILDKLNGHDGDWKTALAKAMEELDGKLDRQEMNNLKGWLEKQLKALNNKIKTMGPGWQLDDEAAGMKRQLIQRFHCLSCDKPINVMPHVPIPSIPSNYGLPKFKSSRPYTTFELDQIRQHAKSLGMNPEYVDYYATVRQCGGSHTVTNPHKKITKMNNIGNLLREEESIVPLYKEEFDVQGADGQIYKGRLQSSRMEARFGSSNLTSQHVHPVYMEVQHRSQSPLPPARPMSARQTRPSSSRSASAHSNHRSRPGSSHGHTRHQIPEPDTNQAQNARVSPPPAQVPDALADNGADDNLTEDQDNLELEKQDLEHTETEQTTEDV